MGGKKVLADALQIFSLIPKEAHTRIYQVVNFCRLLFSEDDQLAVGNVWIIEPILGLLHLFPRHVPDTALTYSVSDSGD